MLAIFDQMNELFRWLHVLVGIVWIGMLYYFNFVQTEYFKEAEASAKSDALQKLAPRALWWFRWGAALTLLTGLILLMLLHPGWDVYIFLGSLMGIVMAANVWFVIWPKQKIVIENATRQAGGQEALPEAADALARAGCVSRHNTLFSVPMLFFMISSAHVGGPGAYGFADHWVATSVGLLVIAGIEMNALYGDVDKLGIASVSQVVGMGFVLTLILALIAQYLP